MRLFSLAMVLVPLFVFVNVAQAQQTCDDIGGDCFEGCPEGWVSAPTHPDAPVGHPPEYYGDDWGCFDAACCVLVEGSGSPAPTTEPTDEPGELNYEITVDGEPVWPPTGPDCEPFVTCCDAMAHDSTVTLTCQLLAGADIDCAEALVSVRQVVVELGIEAAEVCGP